MEMCPQCQAEVRVGQKFCANCGSNLSEVSLAASLTVAQLKSLVAAEVNSLTQDGKLVEYETSIAVVERVSGWAKLFAAFLGIPVALGLGLLTIMGINSYDNFVAKIDSAKKSFTDEMMVRRKDTIAIATDSARRLKVEAKAQLDLLEQMRKETVGPGAQRSREIKLEIERLAADAAALRAKLGDQEKLFGEVKRLNESVGRIERLLTSSQLEHIRRLLVLVETGSSQPNYSAVSVIPGDSNGITYGYIFASRSAGTLGQIVQDYSRRPEAKYAKEFEKYRTSIDSRDPKLDADKQFAALLKDAGGDPVMHAVQDNMFSEKFFKPAFREAERLGIRSALGVAVVLDSNVNGRWAALRDETIAGLGGSPASGIDEKVWVRNYLERRRKWLQNSPRPELRAVTKRVEALIGLVEARNWDLAPPIVIDGKSLER